jgi:hypothetical protein
MPKADATGLAPKKSAAQPSSTQSVLEGFGFSPNRRLAFLWWSLGAEALGIKNAKTARLFLPGVPNPILPP